MQVYASGDFLLTAKNGEVYINEVKHNARISPFSMFLYYGNILGYRIQELIEELIRLGDWNVTKKPKKLKYTLTKKEEDYS